MMDPADIQPGDVLIQDEDSGSIPNTELLIIAIGPTEEYGAVDAVGAMYSFLDEIPFKVYGPWILYPGSRIGWSKKGASEVT